MTASVLSCSVDCGMDALIIFLSRDFLVTAPPGYELIRNDASKRLKQFFEHNVMSFSLLIYFVNLIV